MIRVERVSPAQWLLVALALVFCLLPGSAGAGRAGKGEPGRFLRLDAHNHILPYVGRQETDFMGGARAALKVMDKYRISTMVLMPHPFTSGQAGAYTYRPLQRVVKKHPDRFVFLGGGGTLNVMLHHAVARGAVSGELKERFIKTAEQILAHGAIGFGELVAEHFSMHSGHPYESAPPDHPLLLLLADIAARHDVPIDLHMEAIPRQMDRPPNIPTANNPAVLPANIEKFERLLDHNKGARFIWAHAGWDNTGFRTIGLMRELLGRHPNLYMSIKVRKKQGNSPNHPLAGGRLRPDWLALIKEYPDRFMIGSDQFYQPAAARNRRRVNLAGSERVLNGLPEGLARRVGYGNAARVFNIEFRVSLNKKQKRS